MIILLPSLNQEKIATFWNCKFMSEGGVSPLYFYRKDNTDMEKRNAWHF